uniref:Uncharacterized protein n=1 Tax=Lactuca sativa TaxID=4236 RepID=A0A9R1V024_LACSA|nr:hypothetical protein LSAT_V11C700348970 [Lactuca sativa]
MGERYPNDVHSLNFVDIVRPLNKECFELTNHDFLELALNKNFDKNLVREIPEKLKLDKEMLVNVEFIDEKKNMGFHEMGIHQKLKIQELEEIKNEEF